jgi:thiamine kinase-like enzyme
MAAHTDLHWANLMAPEAALVDWEGWGLAPAGFDAASLYLHSLLEPEMAERVHREFADVLDRRDGLLAQLYVTGRMLLRINSGDYPDLAIPLHHNAERVITALHAGR